jgi:hypothetical protein
VVGAMSRSSHPHEADDLRTSERADCAIDAVWRASDGIDCAIDTLEM